MVNTNQNDDQNEELKLSPLGIDEINSVIKSFKSSNFNQEDLYKKGEKNFVKKTLFDLAKESERSSSQENKIEIDASREENDLEKKNNESQEIVSSLDQKNDLDDTNSIEDSYKNNENKQKEAEEIDVYTNETNKLNEVSADQSDEVIDEMTNSDKVSGENITQDINHQNENTLNDGSSESNKTEYEEKTLEALDSVREAVTKSLEENREIPSEEIKNDNENAKFESDEIKNEINLINALFKNIREISNDEIENIVKSKVIELAEGVIGYQIEKFPDKFLNKIKKSISEIKSINNDVKIYLNKHDFELLNKFINKNETEIDFKLDLDTSLGRGDFTIDIGGVIQAIKYKKVIE